MNLGPRAKSIYSSTQWGDYRERLKKSLYNEGLSAIDITNNTDYKTFVSNYVQTNVVNAATKNTILGISHRLANVELTKGDVKSVYPVINEYKGHDLTKIYYFKAGHNGTIEVVVFPVVPDGPVILMP